MPCVFSVSLQVPGFLRHSHQTSLGVCEILVLRNPVLKSERCLWRLSRSHLDPLIYTAAHIIYECLSLAVVFQLGDIRSLWHFLALLSPYRLKAQVDSSTIHVDIQ